MTRKVFWGDPYLTTLEAKVAGVAGDWLTLDRTIFFALSGGQESDRGTIAGRPVLEAAWQGREIGYRLASGHGLAPGDAATIEIDWPRRYRLMRLHFAAEIVLELVMLAAETIAAPVEKIGAHIAEDKARIDFLWPGNIAALFPELEARTRAIVEADQPITSAFSDAARERRYWQIDGLARVPCGGTHLKRTGEIGAIVLKRKNIGRGKERVEITLVEGAGDGRV